MLITTLYTHLCELVKDNPPADAKERARLALRTVTPRWNGTEEHWYVIHPDTGAHHTFDLCEESGYLLLQMNEPNMLGIAVIEEHEDAGANFELGNFLTVTLHNCDGQTEFLISDDWDYKIWRA